MEGAVSKKEVVESIHANLEESLRVQRATLENAGLVLAQLVDVLVAAWRNGGKMVLFGNGGSAADAQHIAAELVNRFRVQREPLPAIALTTDTSVMTSVANDTDFEWVFARQVEAIVREGDVAVGLSTSGKSPNVLAGLRAARERGAVTVGFTGRDGGRLKSLVDLCFCVPSIVTPRIQEAHIIAWHAVCAAVEAEMFGQ